MKKIGLMSVAWLLFAGPAFASFHLYQIDEIFSDATGTVQFIELFTTSSGQNFLTGHTLTSGGNTVTFGSDLIGDTANSHVLLATPGYYALSGVPPADFNLGVNQFFNIAGDTIDYAGVNSLSFTSGQLPLDGLNSLNRAFNSSALTTAPNSPQDFAGNSGSVQAPTPEPATGAVLGAAIVLLIAARRARLRPVHCQG
jgi:serralysin